MKILKKYIDWKIFARTSFSTNIITILYFLSYLVQSLNPLSLQIFFKTLKVLEIGKYIANSLHLGQKYARLYVFGHYLFRQANSFPRGKKLCL